MTESKHSWVTAYAERLDLVSFGSAGLALFAMALKFGYDDLETIGADAVVDGPGDKECDVVYIDRDQRMAVIAQSYRSDTPKQCARDGKAATLRQAMSYLVEVPIQNVPERLQASAGTLRSALDDGTIDQLYIWFVHNCPGSLNVTQELAAVSETASSMISSRFSENKINIFVEEISSEKLEKLYTETSTPILVNDVIEFDSVPGMSFKEGDWECIVAPLNLKVLQDLYKKYKTDFFSANVRDFLGVKSGDSNINYQMQKSLNDKPFNFFVYNNGLTVLTHKISQTEIGKNRVKISVQGFSIVNGAQTTGTIGTSQFIPPDQAFVLVRFISTSSEELVGEVVRYNNSQNAVTASDFRSTDSIQRRPKLLPSYSVGQALAALHGFPAVSYNEKSAIWSRDTLYSRFFNDNLTAKHIVFSYSLLKAIENEKSSLRAKEVAGNNLTAAEREKLSFYRKRGSVFLLLAAIGECLESIADRVIINRFSVSFSESVSPESAAQIWKPTVEALSGLHTHLDKAFSDGLKNQERISETLKAFSQLVASLQGPYSTFFSNVRDSITYL
ncbi:MAG: AIPR family protein [Acetobacter sp.]|jgi:hypothetical protein|nr:AIPR family protein [Acetobacter sp.]MCH4061624.1 AIPR family protein [Acetobacter sp.]MCH4089527.1 AIPR family protein [Acetobacter sp.]MCI1294869.1 AIPR family protein [Acetobacter sp.]MCI1321337.1 AIPR family protein [Acetobacter sp.]